MKLHALKEAFRQGQISKSDYISKMYEEHALLFEYQQLLGATDIRSIEITDDTVVFTTRALRIKLLAVRDDERIAPFEILNFGSYERQFLDMVIQLIDESPTLFDIGANVGWHTINLFRSCRAANIYAFEPIPKTYELLNENLRLNSISSVGSFNHGFADKNKEVAFYYYSEGSGNASLADLTQHKNTEKIACQVRRVDDVVEELGVTLDFIKVDVEGAELLVLRGATETIARDKPIIACEMLRKWSAKFNYHPNEIIELLRTLGYACYTVDCDRLKEFQEMDEQTTDTNFFFLHKKKHRHKIEKYSE